MGRQVKSQSITGTEFELHYDYLHSCVAMTTYGIHVMILKRFPAFD